MQWSLSRIALHTGIRTPSALGAHHLDELLAAIRGLGTRPDIGLFWASAERYRTSPAKAWIIHVGQLRLVLYHRGQIAEQPRKMMPAYAARPPLQPAMHAVVERWLAARRPGLRPSTAYHHDLAVRRFLEHLGATAPEVTSFAQVTRPPTPSERSRHCVPERWSAPLSTSAPASPCATCSSTTADCCR
jgi:hypothetical protein